jgi:hypothetical protein
MSKDKKNVEEVFEEVGTDAMDTTIEQLIPGFGTENWQEYVMRQFKESELDRGAPKADGLRRVLQLLIGPIIEEDIPYISPPNKDNNFTTTLTARVCVIVTNENHPLYKQKIIYTDIADTNQFNTDKPYHKYPSATSCTRAQGRIFRKMLGLSNVYAAEEVSENAEKDTEWSIDEPINDSQITVIDTMCKRLNLSVMEYINSGKFKYADINAIGHTTAQNMIQELNKIQQNKREKPKVNTYVPNWKS